MSTRKDNLKALFQNTRSRVIILFTFALIFLIIIVGVLKFKVTGGNDVGPSDVSQAPGNIQSIPGALDPTAEYANLQALQNQNQVKTAEQTGGSAIPTIIRSQALGEGVNPIGSVKGEKGVGFAALSLEGQGGPQRSLWLQELQNSNCSKAIVDKVMSEGASINDVKAGCSCLQLKDNGFKLDELNHVCSCPELKSTGYSALEFKQVGFTATQLKICGFDACAVKGAGFNAQQMKDGGYSDGELLGAGFSPDTIAKTNGIPDGMTAQDIKNAGCSVSAIQKLKSQGVSASAIRQISGCSLSALKAAGYSALDLKNAGFSAAQLKNAGFTASELKNAGFSAEDLLKAGFTPDDLLKAGYSAGEIAAAKKAIEALDLVKDCNVDTLKAARARGVTAKQIVESLGCSLEALKAAGYTAKELADAGFSAAELKNAGFSAAELKAAGFSAKALKDAGFSAAELKAAGFSAKALKDAGFSLDDLKNAGFSANALKEAGYSEDELKAAGVIKEQPAIVKTPNPLLQQTDNQTAQLQKILQKQNQQIDAQRFDSKIQQRTSEMVSMANQLVSGWKNVTTQTYIEGESQKGSDTDKDGNKTDIGIAVYKNENSNSTENDNKNQGKPVIIRTGDILFAVIDTSVNTDEPGPILATIVSGRLKGSKLIGSFNLPSNADKMVITFNTLSIKGADRTTGISAYAIDPNTARTALSSASNHHYLMRYGSLFASSFIQGFGNAFQSANTTVTVGGTGGGNNVTVSNGVGRSALENAVIGLATVGKTWGQFAQQQFNTPTTVEVYTGTTIGVLFTQDLRQ